MSRRKEVERSISSIYSALLDKRKREKDEKEQAKLQEKEARKLEKKNNKPSEEDAPMSKRKKRQQILDNWREVLVGLTGEDLDFEVSKKKKKKYKKWITDDENTVLNDKPKKKKKKNYSKEFAPELSMLKHIVTDQNRFTADLLKRYQYAAGPNTKDATPLNKTLVELASVINASRANALGTLKEIGNIKKTISDLYMRQAKLDMEDGKSNASDTSDLGLLGSSLASSIFDSNTPNKIIQDGVAEPVIPGTIPMRPTAPPVNNQQPANVASELTSPPISAFDPSGWNVENVDIGATKYESIPHKIVVEYRESDQMARYKAIREDNGEELVGYPVPTGQIKSMDLKTKMAKDDFDQLYPIEMIG